MLYREIIAVCSQIHTKHITWIIYKDPARTSQWTHSVSVIKTSQLMLYKEIIALCSQIHTKHITCIIYKDTVRTGQWTHSVSVIKTSQLMLYRDIIAVCSEIHTKHINTLCGQNVEFLLKIILGGIWSICRASKELINSQLKPFTPR